MSKKFDRYWDIAWDIFPHGADIQELVKYDDAAHKARAESFGPIDEESIIPKVAEYLAREAPNVILDEDSWPKTLHCIGSLGPGGAERQLINFMATMDRRGHDRQILLSGFPLEGSAGHYAPMLEKHNVRIVQNNTPIREEGVEIIRNNFEKVQTIKGMPFSINAFVLDLWVDMMIEKPVIGHMWLDHCNIWGGLAAIMADVPGVLLSTRNVHPMNFPYMSAPYMRAWYSYLMKSPRVHMLNNSHPGADSYAEWLGIAVDDIDVVLNGVNLSSLKRASKAQRQKVRNDIGIPEEAIVVTGAFRMSDEKRPLLFVETFARARKKHPGIHAVLMGEGGLLGDVKKRARELGLEQCFHAIGRRNDIARVMSSMDIFLHTAWWEGTPNIVLEAQHLKLPVVVTRAGGAVDAVDHGVTGLLVAREDEDALAAALTEVIANLDQWRESAKGGPAFIRRKFSVNKMVNATLKSQYRTLGCKPGKTTGHIQRKAGTRA